jgi:RNA polymerase sigma factor (sigma-70 family)
VDKKDTMFLEIIAGLRARDERVQERIYVHYWGYLMGISTRYFKDRNIAKEVVNDSFMKAFRTMYDFRHGGDLPEFQKTFKSWLSTITVRTALDKIRSNKTALTYVEEYDEVHGGYVEVEQKLFVGDILKLMDGLPDLHRAVFNLYEIEGFSHDEIASLLTIPVSSSRTYLTRAKQKLRDLYKKSIKITDGTV